MKEAQMLKEALTAQGITAMIIDSENGLNFKDLVFRTLSNAAMMVIFGTDDYGTSEKCNFSTKEELQFAKEDSIPTFLIKMCSNFNDPVAQAALPNSLMHVPWIIGKPMPDDLVPKIVKKYTAVIRGDNTEDYPVVEAQAVYVDGMKFINSHK